MRPSDAPTTHLAGPRTLGIPKIRLKVLKGPDKGTAVTLEQDEILIGGADGAHLRLTDPTVSRNHCVIRLTAKGPLLRDLGSTNGTRIEGVEVREGYVPAGATLALGHTQVRFEQLDESVQIPLADSERFGRLWGRSTAMRRLFALAGRVAASDVTVLIQGETGTGKDALTEAIHQASTRAAGPLVVVDCGAVPPNLFESELFGHERGAFTGADRARPGLFERAAGGTLLLDEIGEIDRDFQGKLLRALQERTVQRVGGDTERQVDVRAVAATNRDLRTEVAQGRFREDLYFRLAVIPIHIPPLRERRDDVLPLARHFLAKTNADLGRRVTGWTPEVEAHFVRHEWPGNTRELENAIERGVVLARGEQIELPDLLLEPAAHPPGAADEMDGTLQAFLDRAAADRIRTVLAEAGGVRAEAARRLGMDRTTLYRLMRKYGMLAAGRDD